MQSNDIDYYRQRAETEALRVLEARSSVEATAHNTLAILYKERVNELTKGSLSVN